MKKPVAKVPKAKTRTAKSKAPLTAAQRFAKLWAQVQKEKASIQEALAKQAALVAQFEQELWEQEVALSDQLYGEAAHLLGFVDKKSLGSYNRMALLEWVAELVDTLYARPFPPTQNLTSLLGTLRQAWDAYFPEPEAKAKPQHTKPKAQPASSAEQADLFGVDESLSKDGEPAEPDADPVEPEEDEPAETHDYQRQDIDGDALFSASAANKMFRQLAKVLHPDLEPDETQKALKHEQMSALLKAREQKDVITIFELFCTHIGKGLPSFDDQELDRLCAVLSKQLFSIRCDKVDALHANPLHGMIYEMFHRKNPQHSFIAFKNHSEGLHRRIRNGQNLIRDLRNLRDLKDVLEVRQMYFLDL